jgi:hypothetical protein
MGKPINVSAALVPKADYYKLALVSCKEAIGKDSGKPYQAAMFKVQEGRYAGSQIRENITPYSLVKFLAAVDEKWEDLIDADGNVDWEPTDYFGVQFYGLLKIEEYNNMPSAKIAKYVPAGQEPGELDAGAFREDSEDSGTRRRR